MKKIVEIEGLPPTKRRGPVGIIFLMTLVLPIFFGSSCDSDDETSGVVIARYPEDKTAALSFTWDDGCESTFTKIVPLLHQYNLQGTFFIITSKAEQNGEWPQWKALHEEGQEIASHSLSHLSMGTISDSTILKTEIDSSYRMIEHYIGKAPFSFGHPYHSTSALVDKLVFRKYYATKISPPGFCNMISLEEVDMFKHQMDQALQERDWIVTTAHGIDDCPQPLTHEFFTELFDYVTPNDDIYIDTFERLAKYKIERINTRLHVTNTDGDIVVQLSNDLPQDVFDMPLTVSIPGVSLNEYQVVSEANTAPIAYDGDGRLYVETLSQSTFRLRKK
ncbi:polysaccharide deacetylase family protein [Fulvivirgaceae bacterium PWU5]|uniref:Polysaccharide deacetylase family protein n=1 Tax=Dawidia cretensis TaxID=2782350 RepID=A0AAP2GWD6_9BACT|nr:polysaccharide deacetylase family protein [Dawidia cretensis]MBT1712215.1 polysaccharide deacetylase family protein [Dawidia cretensis]